MASIDAENSLEEVVASTTAENSPEEVVTIAVKEVIAAATETKTDKPKAPKGSQPTPAHPPYFQMIKEVISSLKEKGGSSPRAILKEKGGSSPGAIAKYMEEKHKAILPPNYKKMLAVQIKKLILASKLTKVKASFKLEEGVKKVPAKKPVKKTVKDVKKTMKPAEIFSCSK